MSSAEAQIAFQQRRESVPLEGADRLAYQHLDLSSYQK